MNKRNIIFFLCILSIRLLQAQELFVVEGHVRDELGNLLNQVDVHTKDLYLHTFTDSLGYYKIVSSLDTLFLEYSCISYESNSKNIIRSKRKRNKTKKVDVILKEDATLLEDVTVRGARLQLNTSEAMNIKELEVLPEASGGGIESLVKTFQGVSSTNELSSQYSVRGGSYDENSVYVNGIEVYRPYLVRTGEQEGLSFVNPDMVGAVNFSGGAFDARYGDKLSSVLDITYRKPTRSFEAGIAVSLLGASAYLGAKNGKFTQLHGVRYKNSSLLLGTLQTDAEYQPNFFDYQTYMTYEFSDQWELSFLGNFSQNSYNFTPIQQSTSFGPIGQMQNFTVYFDGQEEDLFRTIFGALQLTFTPNDTWTFGLTTSVFHTNESVNYDISGEYWLSKISSSEGDSEEILGVGTFYEHARNQMNALVYNISHDGSVKLSEHNVLSWGLDLVQETVQEETNEWERRDSSGYSIPYNPQEVNLEYSLSSSTNLNEFRVHAYVQDEYKWHMEKGGIMAFNGGLRLNYWTFNREFTVSPRATIAYFPDIQQDIRFRFATGLYYQQPSFKEVTDTVTIDGNLTNYLNNDIVSQSAYQVLVGMDYYFSMWRRPFKFTTELYYKDLKNIIPYSINNVSIDYEGRNNGEGYVFGLDVKLFGEFVPGVDSWVSFSLMSAKEDIYGDGYGYISRPTDQLFNVSLFFQDYIPGLPQYRMHILLTYAQGLPVGPPRSSRYMSSSLRMPNYQRVDIGFSRVFEKGKDPWMGRGFFKPFQKMMISVECLNLFGTSNVNSYYWITAVDNQQYAVPNYLTGRQFNLKLQLDF